MQRADHSQRLKRHLLFVCGEAIETTGGAVGVTSLPAAVHSRAIWIGVRVRVRVRVPRSCAVGE